MGLFRLGFVANFLSHPVIAGFITASGLLIAASQLKHILGIDAQGHTLLDLLSTLIRHLPQTNWITLIIGASAIVFLFWVRKGLAPLLARLGFPDRVKSALVKAGPVAVVGMTTLAVWGFDLNQSGVQIVGAVPQSLPPFTLPPVPLDLLQQLVLPAFLISLIGFVESISVAQTLAAKKRQRIDPDQELIGLGAANIGAALTGGFPVTGGFSRSVVNFDAGAETPAAGAFTAIGLAIAALLLTPLIYFLPKATLAATIIVAVLSLVDFSILTRSWHYSKSDFCRRGDHDPANPWHGRRSGRHSRCAALDPAASIQVIQTAYRRSGPRAGHRTLPQCLAPQGDHRPRCRDLAGGREPLFCQRAVS